MAFNFTFKQQIQHMYVQKDEKEEVVMNRNKCQKSDYLSFAR